MPCEEVGFIFSRRNGVKTDQIPTKKTNLSVWVGMATRPQWNTMEETQLNGLFGNQPYNSATGGFPQHLWD